MKGSQNNCLLFAVLYGVTATMAILSAFAVLAASSLLYGLNSVSIAYDMLTQLADVTVL
jgi:hypothetical protein